MDHQRTNRSNRIDPVLHAQVVLSLAVRDLTLDDLADCRWSGNSLHLEAVARELERAAVGEIDYLAICVPAGTPVAIGGVDFVPFPDAGYLYQLAVHPMLRRCGIGTLLVGALEERIHQRGRSHAELRYEEHDSGNRAFYEQLGYTAYGTVLDGWDQRLPSGQVERYETTCVLARRALVRSGGMEIQFRPARADDAQHLSDLALRSKGHWGYSQEFRESCRAELTYSPEVCASGTVVVAERSRQVLGFYRLIEGAPVSSLESLFVDPDAIGTGLGRALLKHALSAAEALGAASVTLEADPYAVPFYARYGAVRTGEVPSASIPGRTLPLMRFDLA